MDNCCRLCGKPLPKGVDKADVYFCGECSREAAELLACYIVEELEPKSDSEYREYIALFLQAAEMLHYLPEWHRLQTEKKRLS